MSSSPSTQTQEQPTSPNRNLERTDIRNPHRSRNRHYRSINHSDSGRDETGSHSGQRQTTDRRRRPKPKASIADGQHASPSTPLTSQTDAPSRHTQSDQAASAASAPGSVRTSLNNRNRLPRPTKGRAITTHAQGLNSLTSEPSAQMRRAGRSNPGTPAPINDVNSPRKRGKAPTGDDLTSILTFSLSNPPFPECMICFNPIRPEQPTWSCSPREEKEAQSCWNTFHLKCIHPWAEKSVKDLEEAWRARGEEKRGEWRCPGCQLQREIVPRKYW